MICGQCGHANPPNLAACERCRAPIATPGAPAGNGSTAPGFAGGSSGGFPPTSAQPQVSGFGPPPVQSYPPPPQSQPPPPAPQSQPPPAPPQSQPPQSQPGFSAAPPPARAAKPKKKGGMALVVVILAFFVFAGAGAAAAAYFLWFLPSQEPEVAVVVADPPPEPVVPEPVVPEPVTPEPAAEEPEPEPEPVVEEPEPEPEPVVEEPEPEPEPVVEEPAPRRPRAQSWEARARAAVRTTAQQCFLQNAAHGSVMVQVSVGHDGNIATSRVVNNGTSNLGVARCISGALVGRRIGTVGPRGGTTLNIAFSG